MRGVTLLYTLLACSTAILSDVNVCLDTENDGPLRHEDCNKFYICQFSRPVEYRCYGDLLFNLQTLQCDSPRNVDCEGRYIPPADDVASTDSTALDPSAAVSTDQKAVSRKKRFLPNGCPDTNIHWLLPHETNCSLFYYCVWGDLVLKECPPGTHFNKALQVCDWPQNANCSAGLTTISTLSTLEPTTTESATQDPTKPDPTTPEPTTPGLTSGPTTLAPSTPKPITPESATPEPTTPGPTTPDPITPEPTTPEPTTPKPTTPKPTIPEFLPNGCPVNPHIHWLLPHETDCTMFYYCVWGDLVLRQCAPGTHFNSVLQVCDWPQNANCSAGLTTISTPSTPEPTTTESATQDPTKPDPTTPEPTTPGPTSGPTTLATSTPEPTTPESATPEPTTPGPTIPDPITPEPTTPEPTTPKPTHPKPTIPEFLPNGCPVNPHIHWLLPHETDCTMFYYCVWGDLVLRQCAPGTHFNSVLQVCDWPQNANCSAGLTTISTPSTPEPTTTESATQDPTKPDPTTPEPTTPGLTSGPTTLAPSTPKPTTPESATPEPTTPGPTTPDPITPEPTTPEPTTPKPTTPKPTIPEFLPNGCPVNPHIHWLLPHETDCTMFYYCVWGDLVLRQCPLGTHFNSVLQVCDWPQNANCSAALTTISTPSTPEPTTTESATRDPTKPDPTTPEPTTPGPTSGPTTLSPSTPEPTTSESATPEPTTPGPTTPDPITPEPTTPEPTTTPGPTSGPTTLSPSTPEPTTSESATPEPTTPGPTTPDPITPEPTTPEPTTLKPTTPNPTKPEFLPNGCPVNSHIHWLLPHETDCTMFYYCVWGDLVLRQCAPGTHFNRNLQVCDWPQDAGCTPTLNKHAIARRALLSL